MSGVELAYVDMENCNDDLFDIDIGSVSERKFKDPKGNEQIYYNANLTYDGKPPFFLVEGDTYGIQKGDSIDKAKGGEGAPVPALPGMIQLASAKVAPAGGTGGEGGGDKDKWQIATKLSEKPAEKDWTDAEKKVISFINDRLRRILAKVLARKYAILQKVGSNIILDAQTQLQQDAQRPEVQAKFAGLQGEQLNAAYNQYFTEILERILYSKISRKVYRKKKKADKEGATFNVMDSSAQYDETKWPTLYAGIQSYFNKQTHLEEFNTQYFQFVEGVPETEWPRLTHQEACSKGWQRIQQGIRFDKVYFGGNSISLQLKVAEAVLKRAISSGMGHKGRLIKAGPEVKRDARLIKHTAIKPVGSNNNDNNSKEEDNPHRDPLRNPLASSQQFNTEAPSQFDPNTIAGLGIPGISDTTTTPVVVTQYVQGSN